MRSKDGEEEGDGEREGVEREDILGEGGRERDATILDVPHRSFITLPLRPPRRSAAASASASGVLWNSSRLQALEYADPWAPQADLL